MSSVRPVIRSQIKITFQPNYFLDHSLLIMGDNDDWQVIYGIFSGVCAFVYRYARPFNRLLCIQIKLPQAQQQHSYHFA
jgi:hypothetical protein